MPRHEELIETYTNLARIAIERDRASDEKSRLEAQLRHSQKMEAIGTLAGGVAHDFNNLMAGVLGYVSLLRQAPNNTERVLKAAEVIETAAHRASDLTTKLLGFARRGRYQSVRVNMNEVLVEIAALLGRTIDKGIEVAVERSDREPWIQGDPAQMHQVLLNLAVNARDAMGGSGRMTLFARIEPAPQLSSGGVVVIGVSDTGPGIPAELRSRVFEPFFTTKATGKGSGMGLATAYGIVQSHGGELAFDSVPDKGTTFRFRLPLLEPDAKKAEAAPTHAPRLAGAGVAVDPGARRPCILVIDDETMVREVCRDILTELGYQVLQAEDGMRGVEIYRSEKDHIDGVVLDMIMPRMGGRDCFRELKAIDPDVRVVLVTGYADEDATRQLIAEGMVGFLRKPYQVAQLAEVVAEALTSR